MTNDWFCPQCFGSYQPGPSQCKCPEPDGYCEYCSAPNPTYERSRKEIRLVQLSPCAMSETVTETTYSFCNEGCADNWMNR